uniref:CSON012924 protein n=1 Tax=Culicoides sonorensis TaxID=179676 RepID=A0A336M6Q6_CULSO
MNLFEMGLRFHQSFLKTTNNNNKGTAGAWPPAFNLAERAAITASATCGENKTEEYCKISDARPLSKGKSKVPKEQCDVCNATRHLIEYAIDGTPRWWQSPSLHEGKHNEYITIWMDLGQYLG